MNAYACPQLCVWFSQLRSTQKTYVEKPRISFNVLKVPQLGLVEVRTMFDRVCDMKLIIQ